MPGVAQMTANMLTQGTEKRSRAGNRRSDRFCRRFARSRGGQGFHDGHAQRREEGSGHGTGSDVGRGAASRVSSRRARPPAPAASLESRRCSIPIPNIWPPPFSTAWFTGFALRLAAGRHAGDGEEVRRATSSRNFTTRTTRPINRCSRLRETSRRKRHSPPPKNISARGRSSTWRRRSAAAARRSSGQHIWLIDKPDAVQTQIRVGKLGIRRSDPDYIPLRGDEPHFRRRIQQPAEHRSARQERAHVRRVFFVQSASISRGRSPWGRSRAPRRRWRPRSWWWICWRKCRPETSRRRKWISRAIISPASIRFSRRRRSRWPIAFWRWRSTICPRTTTARIPIKFAASRRQQVQDMAQRYLETKDLDMVLAGNVSAFRDGLKKEFPECAIHEKFLSIRWMCWRRT